MFAGLNAEGPLGLPWHEWLSLSVAVIVVCVVVRRSVTERVLVLNRMWITPVLTLVAAVAIFSIDPVRRPANMAWLSLALVFGATLGYFRGKLAVISVCPGTGELKIRSSPLAALMIAGLFSVKFILRLGAELGFLDLGWRPMRITDGLILFALGWACSQRVEIWYRARRMLTAPSGGAATA